MCNPGSRKEPGLKSRKKRRGGIKAATVRREGEDCGRKQ